MRFWKSVPEIVQFSSVAQQNDLKRQRLIFGQFPQRFSPNTFKNHSHCVLYGKNSQKRSVRFLYFAKRFFNPLCVHSQILIDFIRRNHAVIDGAEPTGHDNPDRTRMV